MDPIESFDALVVGQTFDFGQLVMTREEILEFGERFDPQPMHVDEAAAAEGRLGVSESIRGRIADLGGTATLTTGSFGTEWELVVPRRLTS